MRGNLCLVGQDLGQLLGLAQARVCVCVCEHPVKQRVALDPLRDLSLLLPPLWAAVAFLPEGDLGLFGARRWHWGSPGGLLPPSGCLFPPYF